ncbi:DUF1283 family protein [Lonsdalea quercina]|uniref:UPF0482 protein SAMN02982996_00823 n=1 Tax=Lonsdalea quercina TaxID=71657 RepID=A0A1H3XYT5_9GAMM|nr:DUF1283 family protein [Lonsdalea quercina]SEA04473.1 Protein of unknown function [Lonsdalea quercina]
MNTKSYPSALRFIIPLSLLLATVSSLPAHAQTEHIIVDNGNSALSKETARQSKEQWDETQRLRKKVNQRVEKEFDKTANAIDGRERCTTSANVNAYWEPNTSRCLDRRTGRTVMP